MIVCATIVKDGKVLLVRHSDPRKPDYGEWILPAGRLELGEDPEKGLLREVMEETRLGIKILRKLAEHTDPYTADRLVNFLCHPLTSMAKMSPELMEATWCDTNEIRRLKNIHPSLKRFLIDGLEGGDFECV